MAVFTVSGVPCRPPQVRRRNFHPMYPHHLSPYIPCSIGFRTVWRSHPYTETFYGVSVRWVVVLPTGLVFSPASNFLQIPPHDGHPCLRLTLPTAKCVAVSHRLVPTHAGYTKKIMSSTLIIFSSGLTGRCQARLPEPEGLLLRLRRLWQLEIRF